jgi:molybdopterin molybdotransferase
MLSTLTPERVALEAAEGRVLAEAVAADGDYPAFDNSAMDGFAVRAADTIGASPDEPVRLRVMGEAAAGGPWNGTLGEGEAVRIFTGAPLPQAADSIVPVEATRRCQDGGGDRERVEVRTAVRGGEHVRRAGCDMLAGQPLLDPGEVIDAGALGVMATVGAARPLVVRRPRVTLLITGDELVAPDVTPAFGQVRDVSTYTLVPLVRAYGGDVVATLRVPDDRAAIREAIERAAASSDLLVSVGGVSMGDRDLLRPVLGGMGLREQFWKVAQRPGKPLVLGALGPLLYLGLPGNPISAWTCFHVYAGPAIRRLGGHDAWQTPRIRVVAGEPIDTRAPLTFFLRVRLQRVRGRATAYLTGAQGSNVVSSLLSNDALMIVPPEVDAVRPGEEFDAIPLRAESCLAAAAEPAPPFAPRD